MTEIPGGWGLIVGIASAAGVLFGALLKFFSWAFRRGDDAQATLISTVVGERDYARDQLKVVLAAKDEAERSEDRERRHRITAEDRAWKLQRELVQMEARYEDLLVKYDAAMQRNKGPLE